MKTQLHNYMLNLFEENRRIYMSPMGTSPEKKAPATETAEQKLQNLTPDKAREVSNVARDRIARLASQIKGNSRLKATYKKLQDLDARLDKAMNRSTETEEKIAKTVGTTILELNKVIDTKLPEVRKQILDTSLKTLGKVKSHGQKFLNSMVSAFSMMKVKDSYTDGKTTIKREGDKLFVNKVAYTLTSHGEAGSITWSVKQRGVALSGVYDPIDYQSKVKRVKTETLSSSADSEPKTAPKPKKAVAAKPKKKVGTKEVKEDPTKQLLSDTFKTISNPDVHGQKLTPQQLSALQSFTKSVGKGEVRHFKHGNSETYVARSKDGAVWKISTIVKDRQGGTSTGEKYYAPRATSKITHKLPKQYKGKVAFKDTPAFTIKSKSRLAAARKPKKYDTGEPTPDPKILAMFKNQEKKAQQEAYLSKEMKTWITGAKEAVAAVVERLGWFSKSKALAKSIQAEKGIPFKKASDLAVKFKSRCENCDRDLSLKTMTPAQVIARVKSTTSVLPPKLKASYDAKFNINAGETRLASLKKGIPPSAIPKENLARPKTDTETVDNAKAYDNLAKSLKLDKSDIKEWIGTEKTVPELKLIFGLKEGKSPTMKDGKGNEYYFVLKGKELQLHVKPKGEKKFSYTGKEVNGVFEFPSVDLGKAPKKVAKKAKSSKEGREAYDKNMEKNVKTLMSKFNKLKPNGLGIKFKMKNGASLSVFRKNKDTCYAVDKNGEKASFSLKDGAEVRNIAQILAKNPKFESEVPTKDVKAIAKALKISPREKVDIKESVGVLKKLLEGKNIRTVMKSNKQDLKDYLAHIGGVHKRKNTPGNYVVAKGYTLNVSKNGTVKLKHKGEGTLTYPKNADA